MACSCSVILRRLLLAIPTLIVVVTIIFVIVRVIPGDPAQAALGDQASERGRQPAAGRAGPEQVDLGNNMSITCRGLIQGDLGNSLITRDCRLGPDPWRAAPHASS